MLATNATGNARSQCRIEQRLQCDSCLRDEGFMESGGLLRPIETKLIEGLKRPTRRMSFFLFTMCAVSMPRPADCGVRNKRP